MDNKEQEVSPEIEEIIESSIITENSENGIIITFPAKYMRERLSEKQIQELLDEIGAKIYQLLQLKIEQCKHP